MRGGRRAPAWTELIFIVPGLGTQPVNRFARNIMHQSRSAMARGCGGRSTMFFFLTAAALVWLAALCVQRQPRFRKCVRVCRQPCKTSTPSRTATAPRPCPRRFVLPCPAA